MRTAFAAAAVLVASCAAPAPTAPTPAAKAGALDAASLQGTRWRGAYGPEVDERNAPRLEFVTEGRVSGFTGCNLLHGAWKSEGGRVHVGPLVTTKRGCVGPDQEIERRVVAALNEKSTVSREGAKLVFTTPAGDRVEFEEVR